MYKIKKSYINIKILYIIYKDLPYTKIKSHVHVQIKIMYKT
jgi:hypothetical protein